MTVSYESTAFTFKISFTLIDSGEPAPYIFRVAFNVSVLVDPGDYISIISTLTVSEKGGAVIFRVTSKMNA